MDARACRTLIFAVLALSGASGFATSGELDTVRESVRDEHTARDERPDRKKSHATSGDDHCQSEDNSHFGQAFGLVLISPWLVPLILTDDDYVEPAVVVPEPYRDAPFAMRSWDETPLPPVFGRLQVDFGTNFDGIERWGGQLLLETPWRVGFDGSWSNWEEKQEPATTPLQLGDANLIFRFAQSEDLQFRAGVGANWLADKSAVDLGLNFTYGADYYPRKPIVISTTFDFGTLGHAGLFHNQTTFGVIFRRCEIFTGFEYYHIGNGELSAWIDGLRWRF